VDSIRKTNDLIYSEEMTNDTINEGTVETSTIRNHLQTKNCVKKAEEEGKEEKLTTTLITEHHFCGYSLRTWKKSTGVNLSSMVRGRYCTHT
jgi:hypothetical protein